MSTDKENIVKKVRDQELKLSKEPTNHLENPITKISS